ncbi:MAG: hypothetical protein ABSF83_01230 [Nitrososphaerales archaeon]|jgi:hypothetical protein
MRVLHVWDVSGVASTIATHMDRLYQTQSELLVRARFSHFGIETFPNTKVSNSGALGFGLSALLRARSADVVHVHSFWKLVPNLKRLYPEKVVLLSFHNITDKYRWTERRSSIARADLITVSTPNLITQDSPPGVVLVENPVDTDIFYDRHQHEPGTALHREAFATEEALEMAARRNLKIRVIPRTESISHDEMGAVMAPYEYYIDVKRSPRVSPEILTATSRMGFEALASGLKLIRWDGSVLDGLPDQNRPEHVARTFFEHYRRLLEA